MKPNICVDKAKAAFARGSLDSAFIAQDKTSGKWVLQFFAHGADKPIGYLSGAKTPLRRFGSVPTALNFAKKIGFKTAEVDIS